MPVRVLHVITNLGPGGAQVMLRRLLAASDRSALSQRVVSLGGLGTEGDRLRQMDVPAEALGMTRRSGLAGLLRLWRLVRAFRPEVVQTWMYHADLLGGLAAWLAGGARIVWGLHNSTLDPVRTPRTTHWAVALCARLSHVVPDAIVSVSLAARDLHVARGYAREKFLYVPNGIDLSEFRPDPARRREVREELGLPVGAVVIGLVARVAPQKDHLTFVRAAGILARRRPEVRFLLCGEGATPDNPELAVAIRAEGLGGRVSLLGHREDTARIVTALDLGALSSAWGEALPLVIAEAMAAGVPCAVTDLGDCGALVADTGWIVRPRDPAALASAWEDGVRIGPTGRRQRGEAARERIAAHYSLARAAARYEALYRGLAGAPHRAAAILPHLEP